ncbi:glucosaminidase domain-containing protein [uncultured Chitinophaga sp.]|jgi:Muramidase (flagellum-specific)|uniref:glucosaminidase domain-containing protein n=1 Tax=uncultured Chitinophaga sp. TaxID=339340 RepID=UPI00262C9DC6|nr:glucosaminidase domain-containing protein [uncultured Chitinophaga sp.]
MQLRKFYLVVSFLIGCMPLLKAQTLTTQQYIARYKDIAIDEMRRSGIPASIKLAQGILETQSGNGWLVLNSNNHFGIKCKNNWVGETVKYDDDARQECFRKYSSAADSYRDHSAFLKNNPRYAFLFQFALEDYKSWAYGLKQAGYATSKTYPQQLIKIIEDYKLDQYTQEGLGLAKSTPAENSNSRTAVQERPAASKPGAAAQTPAKQAAAKQYPRGLFEINGRKVLYLPAGTSLIQVASEQHIRLSRLLKYNDLSSDAPLTTNMLIFLQKKAKKGKDDYHVVAAGETMHAVAQAEGIQMKWLRRRNKLREGEEPAAGEKLALDGYASNTPRLAKGSKAKEDEEAENYSLSKEGQGIKDVPEEGVGAAPAPPPPAPASSNSGIPAGMIEDLKKLGEGNKTAGSTAQGPSVPAPSPAPAPVKPAAQQPAPVRGILQYHDVQPKETAYGIAKRYNITIEQLLQWNNLPGTDIKIGQRLLVGK